MSGRKHKTFAKSKEFNSVDTEVEEEIIAAYAKVALEDEDPSLKDLQEIFRILQIPKCFTDDISESIEYYYEYLGDHGWELDYLNIKQSTVLDLIRVYTITSQIHTTSDVIDILDIDKLIKNLNILVKFRNSYGHILDSWSLLVHSATSSRDNTEEFIVAYRLTLPDLKLIKTSLNLDQDRESGKSLGDSFLIDMLSCGSTDFKGNRINFSLRTPKTGPCITIKEFAEILGNLGEIG